MPMETVSFSHPWPAELVQLDIDVFVALGCPAADTAKELTNTIPLADSINEYMTNREGRCGQLVAN